MKKTLFFIVFVFTSTLNFAQQEASNWFFGDGAGIRFNQDGSISATNGALNTDEGCTSISDSNGQLLFYTDGGTVYDRNSNIMQGGSGLKGSRSSTQSAIIVPKPQDENIYYIFTVDTAFQTSPGVLDPDEGFHYYEVNMLLNGGLGRVVSETQLLRNSTEKISAVLKDCNSQNIWVITFSNESGFPVDEPGLATYDRFFAYEVSANGVNTTPVISLAGVTIGEQRGYLKFSPDGTKLAMANVGQGLYLYDFDVDNGVITSNPTRLSITSSTNGAIFPYGLEFSPDNNLLYVSSYNNFFVPPGNNPENNNPANHFSSLVQFNLSAPVIQSSQILIDERQSYRSALQTGPDGKIYRTQSLTYSIGDDHLSVINNPNAIGTACGFQYDAIRLSNNSRQGLPPFITSFFTETIDIINNQEIQTTFLPLCEGESYTLSAEDIPGATYTWFFNGDIQPTPTIPFEYNVFENGLYEVLIELNNGDCETFEGQALVEYSPFPEGFTPSDIIVCDDEANDGKYSFDLTEQDSEILGSQDESQFSVHYFTTEEDALNNENEILGLYENTTNPQQIYAQIRNISNPNCRVTTDAITGNPISFSIQVFNSPSLNKLDSIDTCDLEGDLRDGIITTDLTSLNADILGINQNPSEYTISYYSTSDDALNKVNPLPNSYQNQPFNDEIFVRIETNANRDCFEIDSFTITVNLTPEVNDINLFQCDEDGTPDGRTIFNIIEKENDITGGNANYSVSYFTSMTNALNDTDATDAANFNNTSNPQILVAKVTDINSGCFSYSEVVLEVSVTSANDAYLGICDTDDFEDGFMEFDLSISEEQILDGLPLDLTVTFYETLDDALLETNPLPTNFTNTIANNQTIFVRVENNNNCFGINEVELEVLTLPNVITEEETLYCLNTFPEEIILTGGVVNDIPNNYYYNWSTGETTKEIQINEPGTYTVTVSNVAGCSKQRTITVLASDIASIDNIEVMDTSENNTITVLVSGAGDYEFSLDFPNGLYQDSNVFENVKPGIYTVYIRDKNGCGISEELVSVVGFPKFFTPNGDGQNDFWQVKGVSSQFQPDTIIYIFDKYGKLLSEINPTGSGWDGTYNGNPMPSSDYWFSVTLQDGRRFSSHFTLKR